MATPGEPEFNERKFKELVLYVAKRSQDDPKFGAVKLNKIMYAIDFQAYARWGHPVTGARYMKLKNGPGPRALVPIRVELTTGPEPSARLDRVTVAGGYTQVRLVPLREPDMSVFTEEEVEFIDQIIENLRPYGAVELSDLSHKNGLGWKLAKMGEDIPYGWVFLSTQEPTDDEIDLINAEAVASGWLAS